MAENSFLNLFSLLYDAINGMKKKDLVDHIENLKGEIGVGNNIQGLFNQISKLSENVDRLVTANDKLNSELLIVRNVSQNLQNRIINLEKQQFKSEQYNRCNNAEISGISNEVSDQNLKEIVIELPIGRNAISTNKSVNVKFVNRKHSEAILQRKKDIIKKNKMFASHWLCPYCQFFMGTVQRTAEKRRVNYVFSIGGVVTIRITEKSPAIKVLH